MSFLVVKIEFIIQKIYLAFQPCIICIPNIFSRVLMKRFTRHTFSGFCCLSRPFLGKLGGQEFMEYHFGISLLLVLCIEPNLLKFKFGFCFTDVYDVNFSRRRVPAHWKFPVFFWCVKFNYTVNTGTQIFVSTRRTGKFWCKKIIFTQNLLHRNFILASQFSS